MSPSIATPGVVTCSSVSHTLKCSLNIFCLDSWQKQHLKIDERISCRLQNVSNVENQKISHFQGQLVGRIYQLCILSPLKLLQSYRTDIFKVNLWLKGRRKQSFMLTISVLFASSSVTCCTGLKSSLLVSFGLYRKQLSRAAVAASAPSL